MSRLQISALYGLRTDIVGNLHFLSDDEATYIVGNAITVHNFSQKRQIFNRLSEKHKITFMTISPNRKFAALCETGEKPLISIYDLHTLKKKKLFGLPSDYSDVTSFSCVCFTFDNKYLVAITNQTQIMLFFNFERGKLESSLEVGNSQIPASEVTLISCNPTDTGIIAVGGMFVFKFLTLSETFWRPYGFSKADNYAIKSMTWINGDRMLVGTADGKLLFLENGDLKNIFEMSDVTIMDFQIKVEVVLQSPMSMANLHTNDESLTEISSIVSFHKGFAFALGYGKVIVFEKDGPHQYIKRNVYVIPPQAVNEDERSLYRVNNISCSPSADKLSVSTGWSQLFYIKMWGEKLTDDTEAEDISVLGNCLHHGPVGGLSVCNWKSIIITYGLMDRTVRLWDYETESFVMMKKYSQEVSCTVLHPSGLFCLIGFSDKLKFMSIQINDFTVITEFSIRNCKMAPFSYGGHLFAAVNGNIIQVYSTIDFDVRFLLKGHIDIVQGIAWSQNDMKLVSIGSEGAVYQWDMGTGDRLSEIILKGIELYDIALLSDGSLAYCISSDDKIHEMKGNTLIHSFSIPGVKPQIIVIGKNDSLMFITYPGGFVVSLTIPFQDPIEYNEYHYHCSDIAQMNLTYDEQVLITAGLDGSICFWKISYDDGKLSTEQRASLQLDQILISRSSLANKVQLIMDLKARLKEFETEHSYKIRQITLQHNDKLLEIHQSYCEAIEVLRDKIDNLETDHTNEINDINVEIGRMKKEHDEATRQMEISYDAKLIIEYDKSSFLEERFSKMVEEYEEKLDKLATSSKTELDNCIYKYENFMREKQLQLQEAHEEMAQKVCVHEIIKTQIEDDTDREILSLRASYETKLHDERQVVLKLKGETGVLKNKQKSCEKEIEGFKWQMSSLRDEYSQLMAKKDELDKYSKNLKDELLDKEASIGDRDNTINKYRRSNNELEKVKFVLNERIKELMSEIEPRDNKITELVEKVADMETELVSLNKKCQSLDSQKFVLIGKTKALGKQLDKEVHRLKRHERLLRRIRVDLLEAVGLVQEPMALKSSVIKLYRRYSDVEEFLRSHRADLDAQCEFVKQRSHLQRTIAILKKQIAVVNPDADAQYDKLLEENIVLLKELNYLREELKSAQRHIADMESLLGLRTRDTTPMEARNKLAKACHAKELLEQEYRGQIEECQRIISVLKDDIDRLGSKNI